MVPVKSDRHSPHDCQDPKYPKSKHVIKFVNYADVMDETSFHIRLHHCLSLVCSEGRSCGVRSHQCSSNWLLQCSLASEVAELTQGCCGLCSKIILILKGIFLSNSSLKVGWNCSISSLLTLIALNRMQSSSWLLCWLYIHKVALLSFTYMPSRVTSCGFCNHHIEAHA